MKSNVEWQTWGKRDPLFGVLSHEGKRRTDARPWTDSEFYELGAADWECYLRHWEHYGITKDACVEIGCGAGRITYQLARHFRTVHGVDVSAEMIDYARQHVGDSNVEFHVTTGAVLPLPDASMSAAFSTLVFRHFDRMADGAAYFRELSRVLRPGSSMMIELPIHVWPSPNPLFEAVFSVEKRLGTLRATYRRFMLQRGRGEPFFRRRTYEINWLLGTLRALGFTNIEVRQIELPGANNRQWCVFAHKG